MAELALLFDEQKELGLKIDNARVNYGKDGSDRKSKLEYFEKKIVTLKMWFREFKDGHSKIEEIVSSNPVEHEYIKNKYFEKISTIYVELLNNMESDFEKLKEKLNKDGVNAELGELISVKDFAKRMLDLLVVKLGLNQQLEIEAWQFYLSRVDRYLSSYEKSVSTIYQKFRSDYDKLKLEEERLTVKDTHQECAVLIEGKIAEGELEEDRDNGQLDLNRTTSSYNAVWRGYNREPREELKLPRTHIPKFDGSFEKWPEFRDLFTSMVHSKKYIANVQKMQYLKSYLEGAPAKLIRHLQVTEANYNTAWALVERRYNNKKALITNYVNQLLDQPYVRTESAEELKSLIDGTHDILASLENLGAPTKEWGLIVVAIIVQRLPPASFQLWEEKAVDVETIASVERLGEFIEKRFRTIENLERNKFRSKDKAQQDNGKAKHKQFYGKQPPANCNVVAKQGKAETAKCPLCKSNTHAVYKCYSLKNARPEGRLEMVKKAKLCVLCLGTHATNACSLNWKCLQCKGKHHTLLHAAAVEPGQAACNNAVNNNHAHVLLATALVKINNMVVRALIDQGSTVSFISEKTVQALKLNRDKESIRVSGVGGSTSARVKGSAIIAIEPYFRSSFSCRIKAYILQEITCVIPAETTEVGRVERFENLKLADPYFGKPNAIDLLLGADVLAVIMQEGVICGQPLAQETRLGWVISGRIGPEENPGEGVCLIASLEEQVEKFWKIEEDEGAPSKASKDEVAAEKFYADNFSRDASGRYVVRLPFKNKETLLGRSRNVAVANLMQLEKKFRKNPIFKSRYVEAIFRSRFCQASQDARKLLPGQG